MTRIVPQRPPYQKGDIPTNRERAYLRSFRGTACEACGIDDGTIVPAHLNIGIGGTGWRVRGAVAGLCASCHDLADGRVKATPEERMRVWLRVCQNLMVDRARAWIGQKEST